MEILLILLFLVHHHCCMSQWYTFKGIASYLNFYFRYYFRYCTKCFEYLICSFYVTRLKRKTIDKECYKGFVASFQHSCWQMKICLLEEEFDRWFCRTNYFQKNNFYSSMTSSNVRRIWCLKTSNDLISIPHPADRSIIGSK